MNRWRSPAVTDKRSEYPTSVFGSVTGGGRRERRHPRPCAYAGTRRQPAARQEGGGVTGRVKCERSSRTEKSDPEVGCGDGWIIRTPRNQALPLLVQQPQGPHGLAGARGRKILEAWNGAQHAP